MFMAFQIYSPKYQEKYHPLTLFSCVTSFKLPLEALGAIWTDIQSVINVYVITYTISRKKIRINVKYKKMFSNIKGQKSEVISQKEFSIKQT